MRGKKWFKCVGEQQNGQCYIREQKPEHGFGGKLVDLYFKQSQITISSEQVRNRN